MWQDLTRLYSGLQTSTRHDWLVFYLSVARALSTQVRCPVVYSHPYDPSTATSTRTKIRALSQSVINIDLYYEMIYLIYDILSRGVDISSQTWGQRHFRKLSVCVYLRHLSRVNFLLFCCLFCWTTRRKVFWLLCGPNKNDKVMQICNLWRQRQLNAERCFLTTRWTPVSQTRIA